LGGACIWMILSPHPAKANHATANGENRFAGVCQQYAPKCGSNHVLFRRI
jgi:hypothetical protein